MDSRPVNVPSGPGVSIVICAHNAAKRLPIALEHLSRQQAVSIPWEVLLVDNASTDGTVEVAAQSWPQHAIAPLRTILEPELGLGAARRRGILEAHYEYVCFVDDDNWVAPDWVSRVAGLMVQHPQVGALGGCTELAADSPVPPWFEKFQGAYAVGDQAETSGDVTQSRGYLWGAGLVLRRSAILDLFQNGFESRLTGRKGVALSSGEDSELCYALHLAGWKLWYDADLRLRHFMPTARLTWAYHRALWAGFGASSVVLDGYTNARWTANHWRIRLQQSWYWQAAIAAYKICWRHGLKQWRPWKQRFTQAEIYRSFYRSRLWKLLNLRRNYDRFLREVQSAPWVRR